MSKKKTIWQSEDGATFDSKADADQHELDLIIANEIMERLGFNSNLADRVAKSFRDIAKIVRECTIEWKESQEGEGGKKNQKSKSQQEDNN